MKIIFLNPATLLLSLFVASLSRGNEGHSCTSGNLPAGQAGSIQQFARCLRFFNLSQLIIKIFLLIVITCLFLPSCKKDISVKFPPGHLSQVFIEGMLYPGKKPQIFISKSNPFFSSKVTPQQVFARGAVVKITSGASVDVLVADSTFNKFRCRWEPYYRGNIVAELGKTYTLEVSYEGKTYTASTTINQRKVRIDSIKYTPEFFDVYGGHDGVIITITDPGRSEERRVGKECA